MRGINKVIIVGNLGQDPDFRSTPSGTAVANLSVATSESWRDKNTGDKKEATEWHRVVIYRRLAEVARDFLAKGSKVYIEGKLRTRAWKDQAGNDRFTTEIIASDMLMLDSASSGSAPRQAPANQQSSEPPAPSDFDDDIPF